MTFNKYRQNHLAQARYDFFEKGNTPQFIDRPILSSWQRCIKNGLSDHDPVTFDAVTKSDFKDLKESNKAILDISEDILQRLTTTAVKANYLVILTDRNGIALSVHGNLDNQSKLMKRAFRAGVSFSEHSIGTNAMACSITERQPFSILGQEHFLESNQHFHCAAAPIFSPNGEVIGTVNISRDDNRPNFGALTLVCQCAAAIEKQLFLRLNSAFCIQLQLLSDSHQSQENALIAFGKDGEVIALNHATSRLLGGIKIFQNLRFEDIFDDNFSDSIARIKYQGITQTLRLLSGINVCVHAINTPLSTPKIDKQPIDSLSKSIELGDPLLSEKCTQAQRLWNAGLPVLITGETGCGKEVVANYLHTSCLPKSAPFISLNCAAIPETLIESELFGYVDGAFTGASRGGSIGKIEQADGGTLFLDEIGDMPIALQARLLRVLETGEVCRLGCNKPKHIRFQLLSATNQNIEYAIDKGLFRKDLFYRINGCRLKLSALRDRPEINTLIDKLLAAESNNNARLTTDALQALVTYSWPGNVRELRTAIKFALATSEDGRHISITDLPEEISSHTYHGLNESTDDANNGTTDIESLEQLAIHRALKQTKGKVTEAAKLLGISRATLYRRLKDKKVS